jgi:hypothetical protein
VIQSDLQAAFIEQNGQLVTWVTTTQGQSKAKEGARVQVYGSTYGKVCVPIPRVAAWVTLAAKAQLFGYRVLMLDGWGDGEAC